jgi:hypothetical protein
MSTIITKTAQPPTNPAAIVVANDLLRVGLRVHVHLGPRAHECDRPAVQSGMY